LSTDRAGASPVTASSQTRPETIDAHFLEVVSSWPGAPEARDPDTPLREGTTLTGRTCLQLFETLIASRHVDLMARELRAGGQGFYTIGSSGHEGNAAIAAALRPTDPAFLHYRSGAFYIARSHQQTGDQWSASGSDPIRDLLLGVCAAVDEPIAGGRHKVFGHPDRAVVPQTSTIASHLPRAVGAAFSIERAARLGVECEWGPDAVVVASFGDASVNHSTAAGAINTAAWVAYQRLPLPLLLVCEDNGLGISVRTPPGWVQAAYGARAGIHYLSADGCDLAEAWDAAHQAVSYVRHHRAPAFLHLSVVRYLGHAGSDAEVAYRTPRELSADLDRDPLVATARLLVEAGQLEPSDVVARYENMRARVHEIGHEAGRSRRLATAAEIMAPIWSHSPDAVAKLAASPPPEALRSTMHGGRLPEHQGPRTLAQAVNAALADGLASYPNMVVFGEDVGAKGGVYGVTAALSRRAGPARVFDSVLDEQSILGLALGGGLCGLLPVPEIQYLAYLHNAEDQLRGEAATQQFFSCGRFRNPMVMRIAAYGYQKGFGGHFHNDNSVSVLRDIPGLVIASPSRPDDAAAMLRTCLAAATVDGAVCVFLEPIALYHSRDLMADGDGAWSAPYAAPDQWKDAHVPMGSARVYGDGADLTIVTFANGVPMSLRAARKLAELGIHARVVDLRWLAPLPLDDLLREASVSGRVLIVDETRRSGGVSEGILAALNDAGYQGVVRRVASEDSFIPLGDAASLVLVSEEQIERSALALASSG
jgi:2-oxoisovalerate dehydrogenase E1 component